MHTHTCEAYLDIDTGQYPESFYPRTTDERYSVVAVGDAITQTLNNAGIGTLHDKPSTIIPATTAPITVRSRLSRTIWPSTLASRWF